MTTCAICLEQKHNIVFRCSCGEASQVCEECHFEYWLCTESCPYWRQIIPKWKCAVCKKTNIQHQLRWIFDEWYSYGESEDLPKKLQKWVDKKILTGEWDCE